MFFRKKKVIFSLLAFLVLVIYQRIGPSSQVLGDKIFRQTTEVTSSQQQAQVTRVVDGDTVEVMLDTTKTKVRVIGINTPETVDPRKTVQCFGKEASTFAKQLLIGQTVSLEADPTQSDKDKYGRLLRYIFVNGTDFGLEMISRGYAHEYTYDIPYKYQTSYKKAEQQARLAKFGLWQTEACAHGSS